MALIRLNPSECSVVTEVTGSDAFPCFIKFNKLVKCLTVLFDPRSNQTKTLAVWQRGSARKEPKTAVLTRSPCWSPESGDETLFLGFQYLAILGKENHSFLGKHLFQEDTRESWLLDRTARDDCWDSVFCHCFTRITGNSPLTDLMCMNY